MKIKAGIFLTAILGAGPLLAQPGPLGVDTDGDGLISRAEAQAALNERFDRMDANGDGAVSREEMRAGFQGRREGRREAFEGRANERFDAADTDGDGALSLAELQAVRPQLTQERFETMDRDGDGLISRDERPRRGPPDGRPMRGEGRGPGAF
jgi:hypothetical protein